MKGAIENKPTWSKNLIKLRNSKGYSQTELSKLSGVSASLISQIEGGGKNFTQKTLQPLADALGCSVEDFFARDIEEVTTALGKQKDFYDEFVIIPKYKTRLSGGHGSLETSDQVDANVVFRTEFIRRKGSNGNFALFSVVGPSMEPFIFDGDVVLVDLTANDPMEIIDGKAYAFREDDTVKVKRLSRQGGRLIATSENSRHYPPYEVDLSNFTLFGKVVWTGHEVT